MPDSVKISALPSATTPLAGTDFFPLVQGTTNVKGTIAEVSSKVLADAAGSLALKANVDSPSFTGTPSLPTGTTAITQSVGDNDTSIATTAFVNAEIAADTDYLADFRSFDATRTYALNDPAFYNGVPYRSLQAGNINHTPDVNPTWWEVTGGGSGIGSVPGINFDNGQFDAKQITGWSTYNDGASAVPVDGTGGTASITFAHSTTNPLVGTGMGLLTKTAVSEQGEGVSYDFTVDPGARNQPLKITFQYLAEGSYADADMGCYIYDVTNATLLYPSIVNIPASGVNPAKFESSLWLNANSGSYRLIFHVQSVNTSAYTFKLDNIQVEPLVPSLGAVISEWRSYTPSLTNVVLGTGGTIEGRWRKNGSSMDLIVKIYLGTGGSFTATPKIKIPDGYSFNGTAYMRVGTFYAFNSGTPKTPSEAVMETGGTNNYIFPPTYTSTQPITWAFGAELSLVCSVPISQWSANTNLVEDFTEYASNSNTSNATDSTSFYNGVEGSLFPNRPLASGASVIRKRVRFRSIQATDSFSFEIAGAGRPFISATLLPSTVQPFSYNNGNWVGYTLETVAGSSTDIDVSFAGGRSISGAYGSAPDSAWDALYSSGSRWRVRKISNGNTAESLPPVSAYNAGVSYRMGDMVHSGGFVYNSLADGNLGNAVTDGTKWQGSAAMYGIGVAAPTAMVSSVDNYKTGGIFYDNGSITNSPFSGVSIAVIQVLPLTALYIVQTAYAVDGGSASNRKIKTRQCISGIWSAWMEMFTSGTDGNGGQPPAPKPIRVGGGTTEIGHWQAFGSRYTGGASSGVPGTWAVIYWDASNALLDAAIVAGSSDLGASASKHVAWRIA